MTVQPLLPNITAEQYAQDRAAVVVHSSVARRVQLGPFVFNLVAQDFGSIKDCETAATRAAEIIRLYHPAFERQEITPFLDELADRIRTELGIDPERPLGCCFLVEPI